MTLEAYSEPSGTSKMEVFAKIVNSCQPLIIFAKSSILDVWLGSELRLWTSCFEIRDRHKTLLLILSKFKWSNSLPIVYEIMKMNLSEFTSISLQTIRKLKVFWRFEGK